MILEFISTYNCVPDEQSVPVSDKTDVLVFLSYDETIEIINVWEKNIILVQGFRDFCLRILRFLSFDLWWTNTTRSFSAAKCLTAWQSGNWKTSSRFLLHPNHSSGWKASLRHRLLQNFQGTNHNNHKYTDNIYHLATSSYKS